MNLGAALTRKIGPLPAWGWGVALGGSIVAVRMLRGGGGGNAAEPTLVAVPTGAAGGFSEDFASDLGNQLDQLRGDIDDRFEENEDDWSDRFDDLLDIVDTIQTPITNTPTPKPGTTKPEPKPGSIQPVESGRISLAQAQAALRAIGAPISWASSGAWIRSKEADYVWKSTESMQAWARRVARNQPSYGYTVDSSGKIVKAA